MVNGDIPPSLMVLFNNDNIIVIIITHLCGCHCHYCHNKSDCDAISMILLVRSDDGMSVRLCMVTLTASSDYSPILGIECSSYWIHNENLEDQPSSINWFKIIQIQNHLQQLGKLIVLSFLTRKCYEWEWKSLKFIHKVFCMTIAIHIFFRRNHCQLRHWGGDVTCWPSRGR